MVRLHDGGMAYGGIWSYLLGGDLPGPTGCNGGGRMLGLLMDGGLYPHGRGRSYRRLPYPRYGRRAGLCR